MANRDDVERALLGMFKGNELIRALVILAGVTDEQLKDKTVEGAIDTIKNKMVNGRTGGRKSTPPPWWRDEYASKTLGEIAEDIAERRAAGDPNVPVMPSKNKINSVRYRLSRKSKKSES